MIVLHWPIIMIRPGTKFKTMSPFSKLRSQNHSWVSDFECCVGISFTQILVWTPCLMHRCVCVCIWRYITYVPKKYITQWRPSVADDMQQVIGQHKMLSHIFGRTNHNFFKKKSLNASMPKKSRVAQIFLMFGKNYPNYRKLAKTKKNCPKH